MSVHHERQENRRSRHSIRKGAFRAGVVQLTIFGMLSLGFAQVSQAGIISTQDAARSELRQSRAAGLERFLARNDVAAELQRFGVSPGDVMARVDNLTDDEIAALQGQIEQQVAGGDAIAVIGVVFLVLLILELVGVTDIFKSF
jgi:uncharacterized membrane protein (Fun14 family)